MCNHSRNAEAPKSVNVQKLAENPFSNGTSLKYGGHARMDLFIMARLSKQRPSLSQEHLRPARMKKNGSKKSSRILRAIRQSHNSPYSSSVICLIRLINRLFPRKHLKQKLTDDRVLEEVKRTHRYSTSTQRPLSRPLEYSSEFAGCLRPACILLPLLPWVVDSMLLCLVVSTRRDRRRSQW